MILTQSNYSLIVKEFHMSARSSVVVVGGTRPPSRRGGDRRGWNIGDPPVVPYVRPVAPAGPVFYGPVEDDGYRWWVVQVGYPSGFLGDLEAVYCRKANPSFLKAGPFGKEEAKEWIAKNAARFQCPLRGIFNELMKR